MSGRAEEWFDSAFGPLSSGPFPVTFGLGAATGSQAAMPGWDVDIQESGGKRLVTLTDKSSGLRCLYEARLFDGFNAVEWVAHISNTGGQDSPVIENILPLDWQFDADAKTACELHHAKGSDHKADDFAPFSTPLPPGSETRIGSRGGRSSDGSLPFFNLVTQDRGIIGAVGWTGGWSAHFERNDEGGIRVRAGMRRTRLSLRPGEQIRTPRILLLFWEGDVTDAHNTLRRFILAHHTPRPAGRMLEAPICYAVWGENRARTQIEKAVRYKRAGIPFDCFWIDAGWYGDAPFNDDATVFNTPWASQVGNWFPNPVTYPEGMKPVGDALKEMGLGFLLWLEPERVYEGTRLAREHPEWLLASETDGRRSPSYLFNLGDGDARRYLTDLISSIISEAGLTIYRQDFNMDPASYWQVADANGRAGMSEIRHIEGLYAMWDELLERHPGLVIDNCSSGGRRIDLETISRSIPLWRSDYQCFAGFDPIGMQGQTHGLAKWVPLSTGCCDRVDTYAFRSALGPGIVTNIEPKGGEPFPEEWLRTMMAQQAEVRPFFYGDFYPILSFSLSDDTWAAWQFDRPDLGQGMVLALRRHNSPFTSLRARLRGLEPGAAYEVASRDTGDTVRFSGRELAEEGFLISINEQPGSALFVYRKQESAEK